MPVNGPAFLYPGHLSLNQIGYCRAHQAEVQNSYAAIYTERSTTLQYGDADLPNPLIQDKIVEHCSLFSTVEQLQIVHLKHIVYVEEAHAERTKNQGKEASSIYHCCSCLIIDALHQRY